MKNLFLNSACALFLFGLFALAFPVVAQEELEPPRESQHEPTSDSFGELDSKATSKTVAPVRESTKDSVAVKPPLTKKADNKPPAEDDILSYNFLYYIIQRFKLSDIVD